MAIGWAIASVIISAIGAGISAYSSYEQGRMASIAAQIQADAQKQQANISRLQGDLNSQINKANAEVAGQKVQLQEVLNRITEKRHRDQVQKVIAMQRAGYAKAGVDETGTPLLMYEDTAAEGEMDALAIRYAGTSEQAETIAEGSKYKLAAKLASYDASREALGYMTGAGSSLLAGANARYTGNMRAGGALLTGLSDFASGMSKVKKDV